MELIKVYFYIVAAFVVLAAVFDRDDRFTVRDTLFTGSLWPLVIVLVVVTLLGWDMDYGRNRMHRFQVGRPLDGWPGISVTVFGFTARFWKRRPRPAQGQE